MSHHFHSEWFSSAFQGSEVNAPNICPRSSLATIIQGERSRSLEKNVFILIPFFSVLYANSKISSLCLNGK
ncbi:hypothetical protein PPL_02059 [Heterostelium album PN500]|uniref:Uncharacterized protein n=1 Tax=Heterostelium pallidum (strain ATCC 26659 / Pp 5 / PN500) TaxID=670386 RepID=D3B188_HETP5|nr:hypothetical protein PPL_02059 [Heterostelium album PN500]EFA85062.1 hypothetical protein PPL_02059 [Heterostelium album PN500]|eukprot:XP_020437172.1 hypothetical protein PPL_02059 [Heterostelium album PN500]